MTSRYDRGICATGQIMANILLVDDELHFSPLRMSSSNVSKNNFQPVSGRYDSAVNELNEPWPD